MTCAQDWTIRGEYCRTIKVSLIQYENSKVGINLTLEKKQDIKSFIHLSWNEFSHLPMRQILDYTNNLPIPKEEVTIGGPTAYIQEDYNFFDRIWEYPSEFGRWIRIGVKHFNNATYIFLKLYKMKGDTWAWPFEINFSLKEFKQLDILYVDVYNYGMDIANNGQLHYQQQHPFNPFLNEDSIRFFDGFTEQNNERNVAINYYDSLPIPQ